FRITGGNFLLGLPKDETAIARIRKEILDALDLYFILDPTELISIEVRISSEPPPMPDIETSLGRAAREFRQKAVPISEFGDGVRAFVGIIAAIQSGLHEHLLIDEPEAFLHPPLTRKLGSMLTRVAADRKGNLIASTHSADFLLGCLESGKAVNIVRLTYNDQCPAARLLPAQDLRDLMHDPLLRS